MRDHAPDRPAGILGDDWTRREIARAEAQDVAAMERQEREECRLPPGSLPPGSGIAIAAILAAAFWCFVAAAVLAMRIW